MSTRSLRVGRSKTGLGLFATRPIEKKAYIATYRGRRISNDEALELERRGSKYMFEINSRWTIDGSSRWNLARYANHSCRPNAEAVTRKGKIVLVARRRITPEEEITYHYGRDYFTFFFGKTGCRCAPCRAKARDMRRTKRMKAGSSRRRKKA